MDLLLVLQLAITVALVAVFTAFTAYRQADAERVSDLQTAILSRIVLEHHKDLDLDGLLGGNRSGRHAGGTAFPHLPRTLSIIKGASPPDLATYTAASDFAPLLLVIPLAPVSAPLVLIYAWRGAREASIARIYTTSSRRIDMARVILLLVGSLGYLVAAGVVLSVNAFVASLLALCSALGVVGSVALGFLVIRWQVDWKLYWRSRLYEIALSTDSDSVFARAMLAKDEVERAPMVPLPAALGFYAFTFSVVQVSLAAIAERVSWL